MSLGRLIGANPLVVMLRAKHAFDPATPVLLRHWWRLDAATWWCEQRWREHDRQYRRTVRAAGQRASFEFANKIDALAFRLKFG